MHGCQKQCTGPSVNIGYYSESVKHYYLGGWVKADYGFSKITKSGKACNASLTVMATFRCVGVAWSGAASSVCGGAS